MLKVHLNKLVFILILCLAISNGFSLTPKVTVYSTNKEIEELVTQIEQNLKDSSVLNQFKKNQELWEQYKLSYLGMLYPEYVDGLKIEWGSVSSEEESEEIVKLNLLRIQILKDYLNREKESGTDGKGDFIEYINELKNIQK